MMLHDIEHLTEKSNRLQLYPKEDSQIERLLDTYFPCESSLPAK